MRGLLITGCSQLVTLAGPARPRVGAELRDLGVIPDGAMLVRDGIVERVGARAEIEAQSSSDHEVIDVEGRVVMPGFVDAHTHPIFAGTRVEEYEQRAAGATYEAIAAAGGGIRSTVRKTREATEDELFCAAWRRMDWFLRNGTTTIEAKSGYGLSLDSELKLLRAIHRLNESGGVRMAPTFLGAHEIPDEFRSRPAEYVDLVIHEMLPAVAEARLAEYCDVFCEPSVFDAASAFQILDAARKLNLRARVHADQLSLSGAAEMAARVGAATADHLEQIDERGIQALAGAGVQPVLLPASVYNLGSQRFAPTRAMIDAGLAVVVATDFNPGSSPTPSMPFVLSLACTHMRMTPAEAITASTINAAYSLGRGGIIGSLEPGKQADFAIHDRMDYREIPYFIGVEPAVRTYIAGRLVYSRYAP